MTIEEYWDLTPAEFCCYMKAYEKKELSKVNDIIVQGWYTEFFARQKRLEKLDRYIIKEEKKKQSKNKMDSIEIEKHYQSKVVR